MHSIKRNLAYQFLYEALLAALPLITVPYLSRVLGAQGLGMFSYSSSIVGYFALLALLGTRNYGTRSIAAVREDREARERVFSGIFYMQLLTSLVALLAYVGYVLLLAGGNRLIAWLLLPELLGACCNITWLFFGMERFRSTALCSLGVKLVATISIFLLVHSPTDLWVYVLIHGSGTLLANVLLWLRLPQLARFRRVSAGELMVHVKPNLVLFLPLAATSVYRAMDKTMLGLLGGFVESGYYYHADKVVHVPLGLLGGAGIVLLPRMSALAEEKDTVAYGRLFGRSLRITMIVALFFAFGISAIAREFVPIFFGAGYEPCIRLIQVLAPVMVLKGITSTLQAQYFIPCRKEKYYIAAVVAGAVVNLIANLLLIPRYGAMGAVLGTLIAEGAVCILQIVFAAGSVALARPLLEALPYACIGGMMWVVVRLVADQMNGSLPALLAEIALGLGICAVPTLLLLYKTDPALLRAIFGKGARAGSTSNEEL